MAWWPFASRRRKQPAIRIIRAKYDAAQTTAENREHWANADNASAAAAGSSQVRRTLRNRARYEVGNNSYARGIVLTLANDCIGMGPKLQMLTENPEANSRIEAEFTTWAKAVDLAAKLRTMRMARAQDGEAFAILGSNPKLASPIALDLRLIEADQVATPLFGTSRKPAKHATDGILFDEYGNPIEYHLLKQHPGGKVPITQTYDRIPAASMIHWFRADRPGQLRGLPDILPALPLFGQLRRYTLAVIAAAESAANVAILMKTNAPAGGEAAEIEPMTEMEFERNMAFFAPEGWEPSQIKAEQPATTYDMFKREILNEIARCLNMPYNIAACNSSGYNYASGRLDHQTYYKSIGVDQSQCEAVVLDRILAAWASEAAQVYAPLSSLEDWHHQWFWEGHEHVDPLKEAGAQATRLASNTTTLAAEYAARGKDWEEELRQRGREVTLVKELKLGAPQAPPPDKDDDDDEDEEREEREEKTHATA